MDKPPIEYLLGGFYMNLIGLSNTHPQTIQVNYK